MRFKKELFEKHIFYSPDGCWYWTGAISTDPMHYGVLRRNDILLLAHRVSYSIYVRPVDSGKCVLHSCDNPLCVNPDHLFLGTINENNKDRASKGRSSDRRGVKCPTAKLDNTSVQIIRECHGLFAARQIAAYFNVSHSNINMITSKRTWKEAA